jgi:hypothetical protein
MSKMIEELKLIIQFSKQLTLIKSDIKFMLSDQELMENSGYLREDFEKVMFLLQEQQQNTDRIIEKSKNLINLIEKGEAQ